MKVFDKDGKINYIDEFNVLVGFDDQQGCCEDFGVLVTRDIPTITDAVEANVPLEDYFFDPSFIEHGSIMETYEGGSVTFKMFNRRNINGYPNELYLTFYNCHNGYYGHGFSMKIGGKTIQEGCI